MSAPFLYDQLSYVVLGTPQLDDSIGFYRDLMGLDLCDHQTGKHAVFRCSDSLANFVLLQHPEPGLLRVGMKVKDQKELGKAEQHLKDRGYQSAPLLDEQRELVNTGPGFSVREPVTGLTFDFFDSVQSAATAFTPTVTNIQRLGHVVIRAKELDPVWTVLRDDFNFVASDYVENKAVWLRCYPNPLHHSFAVVQEETDGLHHINFMVSEIDDIGKARNRMADAGVDIVFGPGRHTPSGSVFLYFNDPTGMTMEFSYGMEEFPAEDAREPRALENSAQTMDQWGGLPEPAFAKGGSIIEPVADSMNLQNRVAVVTGGAQGIGLAIAQALHQEGASVVVADLSEDALKAIPDQFDSTARVATLAGDLSREEDANALIEFALEAFGRLDILVNNAGGGVILPFLEHTAQTLQQTLDRNLWTTLWCNKAALPVMREQQYGRVIHIGADSVRNGLWNHAAYNAAKGGVHGLTTGLAREFAGDGITVNTVAPCAVQTTALDHFQEAKPDLARQFLSVIPMERAAECSEIASLVCYLAGEQAAFITGQVISVNGGSTML